MSTLALETHLRSRRSGVVSRSLLLRVALALAAGACLAGGYALHPFWWAPWLAPTFLLAAGRADPAASRNAGWLAGLIAITPVLGYYLEIVLPAGTLGLVLLRMAGWGLAASLAARAARRLPLAVAALVLPATVAALELLTLVISPHGAAGSLAYSQMDMPALVQTASLGGAPAVVFLVLLPGSLAGLLLARAWSRRQVVAAAALALVLVGGAAAYSAWSLSRAPDEPGRSVAAIASNRFDGSPPNWSEVWRLYGPAVSRMARPGMLLVLPEKLALLDEADAARAAQSVAKVSALTGASIVAGIEVKDRQGYRNRAFVAEPDGRVFWYDKQRLVPGFEARDRPGRSPLLMMSAGAALGVAICKDMHIPQIGRQYAGHTGLVADPAWDFGQDGWMGARMTALRGVEGGYAIVRSARNGIVGAYDPAGRPVAERKVEGTGVTIVQARLPTARAWTLYGRLGDLFGWACVAAVALLAVGLRWPGPRGLAASSPSGQSKPRAHQAWSTQSLASRREASRKSSAASR